MGGQTHNVHMTAGSVSLNQNPSLMRESYRDLLSQALTLTAGKPWLVI